LFISSLTKLLNISFSLFWKNSLTPAPANGPSTAPILKPNFFLVSVVANPAASSPKDANLGLPTLFAIACLLIKFKIV